MDTDQIHQLLRKCFSEGRPEDWELLEKVLEQEDQEQLRKELISLGKLKPEDLKTDEEKMWEHISVCKSKRNNRRVSWVKVCRYAALLLLLLTVGGTFHLLRQQPSKENSSLAVLLEPGRQRAILKLEDGEKIDLVAMTQNTFLTRKGVQIHFDSLQSVTYQSLNAGENKLVYHTIEVPRGGEYRLVLPDGSIVWLNSDSELKFPVNFKGQQRKVFLKGEAYFEVAKNPDLPFIVEVGAMDVQVLGTHFNVNAYRVDGIYQTTLVSGKVQVTNRENAATVLLTPDQQAEMKEGRLTVRKVNAQIYTAWRQGKFYFESESLEEIAAQLERWYDIHFFFSRESLKRDEFTGVIHRDYTANEIFDILSKTTNVRFDIKGRTVTVY